MACVLVTNSILNTLKNNNKNKNTNWSKSTSLKTQLAKTALYSLRKSGRRRGEFRIIDFENETEGKSNLRFMQIANSKKNKYRQRKADGKSC